MFNFFLFIESVGSMVNISGTIYMSQATKENQTPMYKAFLMFSLSNLFLLFIFLYNGIIPLAILSLFFFMTSIQGVLNKTTEYERDLKITKIFYPIYFLFIFTFFYFHGIQNINWNIEIIDLVASSLAVIGSYFLSSNKINNNYAFLSFILADVILTYVGYSHGLMAFMLQSMFFIGTSSVALYNNNKTTVKAYFRLKRIQELKINSNNYDEIKDNNKLKFVLTSNVF